MVTWVLWQRLRVSCGYDECNRRSQPILFADNWRVKLNANRDWYLDDQKYGSNEKRRVGRSKNADLLFGIDGSFRSLEID